MSCLSVNINMIPSKFEVGTTLLNKLNVNITNTITVPNWSGNFIFKVII